MKSFSEHHISESVSDIKRIRFNPTEAALAVVVALHPPGKIRKQGYPSTGAYHFDKGDGWFRSASRTSKGFGLMIRNIIFKPNPKKLADGFYRWSDDGNVMLYPVRIQYLPTEFDEDNKSKYKWIHASVIINSDNAPGVSIEDVVRYIQDTAKNWQP